MGLGFNGIIFFSTRQVFGCDMRNYFRGTLFRFPLRTPALAAKSSISKVSTKSFMAHYCEHITILRTIASGFCILLPFFPPLYSHTFPFDALTLTHLTYSLTRSLTHPLTHSQAPYTLESCERLLQSFKKEAHIILLFLKYVELIELYVWSDSASSGHSDTSLHPAAEQVNILQ